MIFYEVDLKISMSFRMDLIGKQIAKDYQFPIDPQE